MLFSSEEGLIRRIVEADGSPVFVVGSGLCMPMVPGTEEMVQRIYARMSRKESRDEFVSGALRQGNPYQYAFKLLFDACGADAVNSVIREAVLNACDAGTDVSLLSRARDGDRDACKLLANDLSAWQSNKGLSALGKIATRLSEDNCWIVTTNFDPLIEVAVRRAGGRATAIAFARDGNLDNFELQDGDTAVVHVHGDWYRADTLHTPEVLTRERLELRASLRNLFKKRLVVVLGYAGWDDVITFALQDVVSDASCEIRWAFRETETATIEKRYSSILDRLAPAREVRVSLHSDVDVHRFLPAVADALAARPPRPTRRGRRSEESAIAKSAKDHDREEQHRARELLVKWRSKYSTKRLELVEASKRTEAWSQSPPTAFTEAVSQVLELAGTTARDLYSLPVRDLQFASRYGLHISPSVFDGGATNLVTAKTEFLVGENKQAIAEFREVLGETLDSELPDRYVWEKIHLVLSAAELLLTFGLSDFARGYVEPSGPVVPRWLPPSPVPVLAKLDGDPGLHVLTLNESIEELGSYVARWMRVDALCSQRNTQGSLDTVGTDSDHIYYWRGSTKEPTAEFPQTERILDAAFLSAEVGAPVLWIDHRGATGMLDVEGGRTELTMPIESQHSLWEARIWVDPRNPQDWHVVAVTSSLGVIAGPKGQCSTTRTAKELWLDPPNFRADVRAPGWDHAVSVNLTVLQGLPCFLLSRMRGEWTGIHFLDPETLGYLRSPMLVHKRACRPAIAAGRWLIAGVAIEVQTGHGLAVWDLASSSDAVICTALETTGDVYQPLVVSEDPSSFRTIQINQRFNVPDTERYRLYSFDWPSRSEHMVRQCSYLQISPVTNTLNGRTLF